MGPRPFSRGNSGVSGQVGLRTGLLQWGRDLSVAETRTSLPSWGALSPLQWGRDLSVAETGMTRGWRSEPSSLQWGRDLSVAETGACRGRDPASSMLQWGRDLSVAETQLRFSPPAPTLASFNGAATFQSRKPHPYLSIHLSIPHASMGPRPFSRGNWVRIPSPAPGGGLQWGRDLSVAETAYSTRLPSTACRMLCVRHRL